MLSRLFWIFLITSAFLLFPIAGNTQNGGGGGGGGGGQGAGKGGGQGAGKGGGQGAGKGGGQGAGKGKSAAGKQAAKRAAKQAAKAGNPARRAALQATRAEMKKNLNALSQPALQAQIGQPGMMQQTVQNIVQGAINASVPPGQSVEVRREVRQIQVQGVPVTIQVTVPVRRSRLIAMGIRG